jgi:hypothetical protein
MKPIDGDALKNRIKQMKTYDNQKRVYIKDVLNVIDGFSGCSIVKEVVLCKNCKHLFDGTHRANCCEVLMKKAKWIQEITVDDNWYCKDGESKY